MIKFLNPGLSLFIWPTVGSGATEPITPNPKSVNHLLVDINFLIKGRERYGFHGGGRGEGGGDEGERMATVGRVEIVGRVFRCWNGRKCLKNGYCWKGGSCWNSR